MTRSQLITKVSVQTNLSSNQVEGVLDNIVDTIIETLARDEKVTIAGFGRFEMRKRKTKTFTNPKTKISSQLEPTNIPGFKASGLMKETIQNISKK